MLLPSATNDVRAIPTPPPNTGMLSRPHNMATAIKTSLLVLTNSRASTTSGIPIPQASSPRVPVDNQLPKPLLSVGNSYSILTLMAKNLSEMNEKSLF